MPLQWVVGVILAAVAAAGLGWFMLARDSGTSRWTTNAAEAAVQSSRWGDDRIVLGTRCLALDPVAPGSGSADTASRFDCNVVYVTRPATVAPSAWNEMVTAISGNNVQRATELLQVAPNASAADIDAASRRWGIDGSRSISDVIGVMTTSTTGWKRSAPQFDSSTFTQADQLHQQLLAAIPSVEAFYVDHKTYAGITLQALRAIDPNVSDQIVVAQSTDTTYCAQLTGGQITWSERGPGGAPLANACS